MTRELSATNRMNPDEDRSPVGIAGQEAVDQVDLRLAMARQQAAGEDEKALALLR